MAVLLNAKDIAVEYGVKRVLDRVTLGIDEGDRIGIVGRNGDGKSTLLKVLGGALEPDAGEVIRRGNVSVGLLAQSDALDRDATVAQEVVGDTPAFTWAADRRTREIIDALLAGIPWEGRISELSGGQRRRVDLARLLIGQWDVLMLDEPTNHLDMQAISWLAGHLTNRWPQGLGALLVVTHDRWFLDEVAQAMWEVHGGRVEPFEGGYSAYILQRVERERSLAVAEQKRQNELRKELAWLARGARARATKPKFHVKLAQELIASDPPLRNALELKRAAMTRLGKQVFELKDVTMRFGDSTVLNRLSWLIGPGDRLGILGENGSGKTTLLKLIRGIYSPTSGTLKTGQTVKQATLSQLLDELELVANERVRDVLKQHKTHLVIDGKEVTTSQLLERLGFERAHLSSFVRDLSGGQKRRLQLLLVLADEPNVLILDEPGNDMDVDMLALMEDLLDSWPGTLLLVSHDRFLMERVTDDQFALMDGNLTHMPGGVDEYLSLLGERARARERVGAGAQGRAPEQGRQDTRARTQGQEDGQEPGQTVNNLAEKQQLSSAELRLLKKERAACERRIATQEQKVATLKQQMADADPSDYQALIDSQQQLQQVQAQIAELETLWFNLTQRLEGA
ncbi:MAG: ATP-binding cassette domain-containing protein [Coriobacteriales bacterium]|jgi:ATPase subunit of ABC transporter with duplicated ATPase domains|nr:ATP-binding cassette domain-containing protein [Coriobacteriales bacterium]